MASRRRLVTFSFATLAVLGGVSYYISSLFAVQGAGTLVQSPLNIESSVKSSFIMGVDNSGSMAFEMLFPGNNGSPYWDSAAAGSNGFFSSPGVVRTSGGIGIGTGYVFVFPTAVRSGSVQVGNATNTGHKAVPPIPYFGFARSHEFNPAYFDPSTTYEPWLMSDGAAYALPNPVSMPFDPRNNVDLIDITADRNDRIDDGADTAPVAEERFLVPFRSILKQGTFYYATAQCNGRNPADTTNRNVIGTTGNTNKWVELDQDVLINVNPGCDLGIRFFPATFYLKEATAAPAGFKTAVVTMGQTGGRSLVQDGCGAGCNLYRYEIKPENYNSGYAAAIQNFANWLQFYGNRDKASIAGITRSLTDVRNMRVAHFKIHYPSSFSPNTGDLTMYDMGVPADRKAIYADIARRHCSESSAGTGFDANGNLVPGTPCASGGLYGGTPNHRAVNRMGQQFERTGTGAPIQLSCQKNAGMLFTDGYSSSTDMPTGIGHQDQNTSANLYPPFPDDHQAKLADIAYKYYKGLANWTTTNDVPVPEGCSVAQGSRDLRLDCQTKPHMNFYGVTLGTLGNIYRGPGNPEVWTAAGRPINQSWVASDVGGPSAIDSLWQASLNTRGKYINATSSSALTSAMREVIESVGGSGNTPSGSIGMTGSRVGTGSFGVTPSYTAANNGTDWWSVLSAQTAAANPITGITFTNLWNTDQAGKIPAHGSRNIWRAKTAGAVTPAVAAFSTTNVAVADLCTNTLLARCTAGGSNDGIAGAGSKLKISHAQAIDYLRGDQTLESSGTTPLRLRTSRLGDIVNSSPMIASPLNDDGFRSARNKENDGTFTYPYLTSYPAFLATKKTADKPMVYVGANDGMLHAFDGKTGVELFAYVPATAVGHMGNLLFPYDTAVGNNQIFKHRFFVDGPITLSDAFYGGAWKSVLVGTAGAGGRSVFGLDVTNPAGWATNPAVLWEVNDQVTDLDSGGVAVRNNIGHVLGKPVIVPVKATDGTVSWKAVFGNGYGSINNDAVLFVVDMATGAVTTIKAEETARAAIANGLGNVVVLDRYLGTSADGGRDGFADTVYAGDQNGAVWKFDLRNNTVPATPFFVAADAGNVRQPIMGGFEAAAGPGGGVMLYFGTGSFSFEGDKVDSQLQTLYGVLDRGVAVSGRAALQSQTVNSSNTDNTLTVSTNVMAAGKLGWYLDLGVTTSNVTAAARERFVGYPRIEGGVVFFPAYAPIDATCSGDGINRLYGLNALTGGAALSNVRMGGPTGSSVGAGTGAIGLATGGSAPVKDVAVMTMPRVAPLSPTATAAEQAAALGARCSMMVQVAGAPPMYLPRPCGRQSWRQVR